MAAGKKDCEEGRGSQKELETEGVWGQTVLERDTILAWGHRNSVKTGAARAEVRAKPFWRFQASDVAPCDGWPCAHAPTQTVTCNSKLSPLSTRDQGREDARCSGRCRERKTRPAGARATRQLGNLVRVSTALPCGSLAGRDKDDTMLPASSLDG